MNVVITAKVNYILFEASDNNFKIFKAVCDTDNVVTMSGNFPILNYDIYYDFECEEVYHHKYGKQYKVVSYKKAAVDTKEGIINFLSSSIFKGVGEKLALLIYDKLGSKCIELLKKNPNILDDIKMPIKTRENFKEAILNLDIDENIIIELYNLGLSARMVDKLYSKYGSNALVQLNSDPYRLTHEIDGFGFVRCDRLALKLGIEYNSPLRIKAAILYFLEKECESNGHTFLNFNTFLDLCLTKINELENSDIISSEIISIETNNLINEKKLIKEDNRIYSKKIYYNEINLANKIKSILNFENDKLISIDSFNNNMKQIENELSIYYTNGQKNAIFSSLNSNLSVITGGPGTGKTTILTAIIMMFKTFKQLKDYDIKLVAPTGKASKKMKESTNLNATTIHKALGYDFNKTFKYNSFNKLDCKLLIIDESSMIDLNLFTILLTAIENFCTVIVIGDHNQLPSITPGNVLKDLIESDICPVSKLDEVMRQSESSNIIRLSNMVNSSIINKDFFKNKTDVYYFQSDKDMALSTLDNILKNYLEKGYDIYSDLQILLPMYGSDYGINAINKFIQYRYNNSTLQLTNYDKTFKLNDKVIQLKNDPELNIMNGDTGKVTSVDIQNSKLIIDFDGTSVLYPTSNFMDLDLAYAISIHKSQGSEYKNVIMIILPAFY
ncbi:MAG: SF1B family DNA helicase RecD2, partial [Anaeroplasmataceae bacterium]